MDDGHVIRVMRRVTQHGHEINLIVRCLQFQLVWIANGEVFSHKIHVILNGLDIPKRIPDRVSAAQLRANIESVRAKNYNESSIK